MLSTIRDTSLFQAPTDEQTETMVASMIEIFLNADRYRNKQNLSELSAKQDTIAALEQQSSRQSNQIKKLEADLAAHKAITYEDHKEFQGMLGNSGSTLIS